MPVQDFGAAPATSASGSGALLTIPDVTGMNTANAVAALTSAGYHAALATAVPSPYPAGFAAYTLPRAGSTAAPGSTITIYPSGG